jgi:hypothetical protein
VPTGPQNFGIGLFLSLQYDTPKAQFERVIGETELQFHFSVDFTHAHDQISYLNSTIQKPTY